MDQELIIAGFGGQGILSMGKILAYAGLHEGKNVSWLPSYGPEMRGGTANCNVIISEEPVGSPIISSATALIVMNQPSLEKFEDMLVPGGIVILDSSLVPIMPTRQDLKVFSLPATTHAYEMGNPTFAGVILLGKFIGETNVISKSNFENALKSVLPARKHGLIPEEMVALEYGINY